VLRLGKQLKSPRTDTGSDESCHVEDGGEPCLCWFDRTGGLDDPPFGWVTARWVLMMVVWGLGWIKAVLVILWAHGSMWGWMTRSDWSERCCVGLRVCFLAIKGVMWVLQSSCFLVIGRVLCLQFKGVFSLHLHSNSCIALTFRGHVELALFWINMRARNVSSPNFLIKLMVEIGP
jgi:hypothetical protein